jgi:hypothetical protein
METRVGI